MTEKTNYTQSPWKLDDLFKNFEDPAIEETYKEVDALVTYQRKRFSEGLERS